MKTVITDDGKFIHEPNLQEVQNYIDYCTECVNKANTRLAEYRKDKDIQELENENKQLRNNSLYIMNDTELTRAKEFRQKHFKSCKNGSTYWYKLIGTGIGTAISIKCDTCGAEEDITDDSDW